MACVAASARAYLRLQRKSFKDLIVGHLAPLDDSILDRIGVDAIIIAQLTKLQDPVAVAVNIPPDLFKLFLTHLLVDAHEEGLKLELGYLSIAVHVEQICVHICAAMGVVEVLAWPGSGCAHKRARAHARVVQG